MVKITQGNPLYIGENFMYNIILAKCFGDDKVCIIFKVDNYKINIAFSNDIHSSDEELFMLENQINFETISVFMNYLRSVRFDHAINYEIKDLVVPLLGELYKNRKIDIRDILEVNL